MKSRKRKKSKKILLFIFIPFCLILLSGVGYGYNLYLKAQKTAKESYEGVEKSTLRADTVSPVDDNVSILIIGVDIAEERDKVEHGLSDALLLATFNKELNNVKLLSIPRDTYVYVPEVGYHTKINHAHSYGGPKSAMETVEQYLNVPVDYYVQLNFNAFIDVIDTIGGIYFDVPFDMSEINKKGQRNKMIIEKGYQKLNGDEALALARTRKYDNDIERGKRQQEIIKAIAKQVTSTSSVFKLDDLMEDVGKNMKTNLTFGEMSGFFSYAMSKNIKIDSINLEGDADRNENGIWYYEPYEESRNEVETILRQHLNLPVDIDITNQRQYHQGGINNNESTGDTIDENESEEIYEDEQESEKSFEMNIINKSQPR